MYDLVTDTDDLEGDLNADLRHLVTYRALQKTQATMARVEKRLAERTPMSSQRTIFSNAENTLAKAAGSLYDSDRIIKAASASPAVDAQTMGVVATYANSGNLSEARRTYLEAVERHTLAKAADPVGEALSTVGAANPSADLSAVTEAIGRLEWTVANVVARLSRLEARSAATPTPQPSRRTVAKAAPGKRPCTAEELHVLIDRYVSDPTRAGAISGMIAAGQLPEAEQMLVAAKRAHDTENARLPRTRPPPSRSSSDWLLPRSPTPFAQRGGPAVPATIGARQVWA